MPSAGVALLCLASFSLTMLSLREPSPEQIDAFLERQQQRDFSYSALGATRTAPPPGDRTDHTRCRLGTGRAVYTAAREALRAWKPFDIGWLRQHPSTAPIAVGQAVAIVARVAGLWWLNACRVVYVVDEASDGVQRFGFAYGTLPCHAGRGEERFMVEIDADGGVTYDVFAFSRPGHLLTCLGYPLMRRYQRRFGRDSSAAMQRAVAEAIAD